VSFLTDVSGDMIFTLIPLFLKNVLGVKTLIIGLIMGVTEGAESILKILGGWLSDKMRKRKSLAILGYGLSTLAKPFMYLANTWGVVLGVRFTDRIGKGFRTSPRDALVADSSPAEEWGKSFGVHRAMDTAGAVVGLVIAAIIIFLHQPETLELTLDTYHLLVLVGVVPAVLAVLILWFFVRERKREIAPNIGISQSSTSAAQPQDKKEGFSPQFKIFLSIMVIFTLGNSSDAFLMLRADNLGFSAFHILLMLILFNAVYAIASRPAGVLSDRLGRKRVIAFGWSMYVLVYLGFALSSGGWLIWLLFAFYGLYYGVAEGVCRACVADMVAPEKRGTAYGLYHGSVGFTLLAASLLAGWLWDSVSPATPFFFGAGLSAVAMAALLIFFRG
jgi:MFS family permease